MLIDSRPVQIIHLFLFTTILLFSNTILYSNAKGIIRENKRINISETNNTINAILIKNLFAGNHYMEKAIDVINVENKYAHPEQSHLIRKSRKGLSPR